jgi:hypothetical protein
MAVDDGKTFQIMEILTPGHKYQLFNFEGTEPEQTLQFIHKDVAMNTLQDGTTNEEVLAVLIDRLRFLHDRLPSRESALATTRLEEALLWLEKRTADRKARGVEGTAKE